MIDPKNISFFEHSQEFGLHCSAHLSLNAEAFIDAHSFRSLHDGPTMRNRVREQLAATIWHHVYGDLRKPSFILEKYARANSNYWPGSFVDADLSEAIDAMRRVRVWR